MPWQPRDPMDIKREFISLATQAGANRRELCRRFGISPTTGYELLQRYAKQGDAGLQPCSRRPQASPHRTADALEQAVVELRRANPCWGGRKIARRLCDQGWANVPAPSTVTAILRRHAQISPAASQAAKHWQRFEHETPNALWQIDFKGDFSASQTRCFPLTLLDDHSRYNLALQACTSTAMQAVQPHLIQAFQRYGLPVRINADNGPPWGSARHAEHGITPLTVWLIRLGIRVSHSAPHHPQTNGKIERFHRSLKAEVLTGRSFIDLPEAQAAFERWRSIYNLERPHDALDLQTPARRYCVSPRSYPNALPPIEYPPGDTVIAGSWNSQARFKDRWLKVPKALNGLPLGVRPDPGEDGCFDLYFCHHRLMRIDLRMAPTNA